MTPMVTFWCFYCYLWTYFTPCTSVSINFEQVIGDWDVNFFYFFFWKHSVIPVSEWNNLALTKITLFGNFNFSDEGKVAVSISSIEYILTNKTFNTKVRKRRNNRSSKKVFLKLTQYSQKNTCIGDSF